MKQYDDILGDLLTLGAKAFPTKHKQIEKKSRMLYDEYCKAEKGKPKAIRIHTIEKIYPCIAFYEAVAEITNQKERAYALIEEYFTATSTITAKKLQRLCRIPFAYKLVPYIMAAVIHRQFGVKSGFEMIDYKGEQKTCHIDMIQCPYFSACKMHGCSELTTVFCNADDVAYGNMHPKLSWERKKTLGRNDICCDFILKIKE